MTQPQPLDLDLDAIEVQAAHLYEYGTLDDAPLQADLDQLTGTAMADEIRRLRARVAELERPAVEAKRNEIRQSFTDLIAAAEETKDYEGAFDVQCRLREREEQWAREDAAVEAHVVADDSDNPDTLPAWLAKRFDPQGAPWDGTSDDDRAYWEHQARAVRRAVARGGFKTDPAASSAAARP
ncbi:hypothetical protein [Streptomyces sp. SID161]|uniref:hypothetical protein n=1 Tax=Streptomyces sp. SID161 TaxID=2690251 RepID=UPI00136EC2DF|nr:hypothetical protein [Streptomyces sp. SID161]MYW46352.1 hypothetical protein [Streptomyces sp. SID161]